jgi:hypothetical protein
MRFLGPITALLSGLVGSALVGAALIGAAWAEPLLSAANPGTRCRPAIAAAEQASAIPPQLLAAIGRVESGRRDPASGVMAPWPWTINAEGQGSFFDTKAQVIAAVQALQARGVQSIDVGCMQVNVMHHPNAFANLDQAFDRTANAAYAARFLNDLHTQTNDWPRASGMYHSATPELAAPYAAKVASVWTEERHLAGGAAPMPAAWPGAPGGLPQIAGGGFHGGVPATVAHGAAPIGRDLAAYRAMPVRFAAHGPSMIRHY